MATDQYVIKLSQGERVSEAVQAQLDAADMGSIGHFAVSKDQPTELHYHDYDEYWYFTEGTTTVTLRTADGESQSYRIGAGDLVVTPKGVEHGHTPDDVVKGIQWVSVIDPNARRGHLHREL
ncbi:MAG: cupin domain-containing protein [Candidatus Poribacteria bacterium]|nr:cupin domain-containing protein [Candidatus Poribacteria bacterium]